MGKTALRPSGDDLIQFPEKLQFLFKPSRYKILYGGRGGAKSWGVARALLVLGSGRPLRILCAREFQNSILDSVHHLLRTQIDDMALNGFYEIQNASISGAMAPNSSLPGCATTSAASNRSRAWTLCG